MAYLQVLNKKPAVIGNSHYFQIPKQYFDNYLLREDSIMNYYVFYEDEYVAHVNEQLNITKRVYKGRASYYLRIPCQYIEKGIINPDMTYNIKVSYKRI